MEFRDGNENIFILNEYNLILIYSIICTLAIYKQ